MQTYCSVRLGPEVWFDDVALMVEKPSVLHNLQITVIGAESYSSDARKSRLQSMFPAVRDLFQELVDSDEKIREQVEHEWYEYERENK